MSQLEVLTNEVRKRASSEAMRESGESRKRVAHSSKEKIMDMTAVRAQREEMKEERHKLEKQAREEGKRVEKNQVIRRRFCCACRGRHTTEAQCNMFHLWPYSMDEQQLPPVPVTFENDMAISFVCSALSF
jgi:hypothetical protein